jgi:hypothetical protein
MFTGLIQVVEQLLATKPFTPFELKFGDESFVVTDPKLARLVDEDYTTLAVFDAKSEQTTFINLNMVQRIRVTGRQF